PRLRYNSALLVKPGGGEIGGRYDKIHRVPFGEYVPLRDWLPWMDAFAPYENDYSVTAGAGLPRLALGKYRFGVGICFQDTDPVLAGAYGRATADGPAADFLVNISNDGWFDGSSEHDEHLAIARFRSVEARRATARAVNMGISGVIDGNGRVLAPTHVAVVKAQGDVLRRVGAAGDDTFVWVTLPASGPRTLPVLAWEDLRKGPRSGLAEPNARAPWMAVPP